MTAAELERTLEAEYETELSRLGSSKALYALTDGEMEAEPVRRKTADRLAAIADAVDRWAAEDGTDFEAIATTVRSWTDELGPTGEASSGPDDAIAAHWGGLDDAPARAGGLLAWVLVTDRTFAQAVGFFVGSADAQSADRFRELRAAAEALRDRIHELLETVCSDESDWTRARAAAGETIDRAYDQYVDALEAQGIKVKPVC